MKYLEFAPRAPLHRFLECFWTLESNLSGGPPERILPDGCVELILNFGDQFTEYKSDGRLQRQPSRFLVGQMTGPTVIAPTGRIELVGIRFRPGGTVPFFRVPIYELNNQVVELSSLSDRLERFAQGELADAGAMGDRVSRLQDFLLTLLSDESESWVIQIADFILECRGCISMDQVAHAAGVSNRQLERKFLSEVGLGPKLFSRILRFQQVFQAIDRQNPNWAEIAIDCGYYDQAHLIRDFRAFAHESPSATIASSTPLMEVFIRKNRRSDFYNTRA
jgi:AraC-like DNA-binding protein